MFAIIMQLSSCKDRITAIITACKCNYPNVRQPSGRQRFSSFSMLQAKIFLLEKSFAMLKAKILLIETSLSMSKGFLDHNLFHDPNVTTIHRDYPDNRAKDVRISILCPALHWGPTWEFELCLKSCNLASRTKKLIHFL